jgi:transposase InsO family protein
VLDVDDARLLRRQGLAGERRRQATHPTRARPELLATAPQQVWSWDITKLRGPVRGVYYDLYVILDIFSRNVVGWTVAAQESAEIAEQLITHAIAAHGRPGSLHADSEYGGAGVPGFLDSHADGPVRILVSRLSPGILTRTFD